MSSSSSPCAACKFLRRKCTQECVFAPYFPPDQPQKFANVHKVFGASNVSKLLSDLNTTQREDAVNSLAYEADFRLRDPVYGCVGFISILQHKLKQVQRDLYTAKRELATYIGPSAMMPILQPPGYMPQQHPNNPSPSSVSQYNMSAMMGQPSTQFMMGEPHQQQQQQQHQQQFHHQQMFEAQQMAAIVAAREQQEMLRAYEQQQQQQHQQEQHALELASFNSVVIDEAGPVTVAGGFNSMSSAAMSPSLALCSFDHSYQLQQQPQEATPESQLDLTPQLLLQQPPQQPQGHRSSSEEGIGSCPPC